jgi:threonine synthase
MTMYRCSQCELPYPSEGLPHQCPRCGGIFALAAFTFPRDSLGLGNSLGIWRYQSAFGLTEDTPVTYLGEGDTPLVLRNVQGKRVAFKMENLNPSGSFKDRGTAVLTSMLLMRGIKEVVEDSSGNAGASLAAYSAAFGIRSHIFVPAYASGPKINQMKASNANVISITGSRENAHQAAIEYVKETGFPYASHALLPFGLAGIASISFEIYEQLGELPGTIVTPVGHGSLFRGIQLGLQALQQQFDIQQEVKMVGVQPARCAPLVARWIGRPFGGGRKPSLAEGTQILAPVHGEKILNSLQRGRDEMISIEEEEILLAFHSLAKMGFYVEPTSALVWVAYQQFGLHWPEPIVLILTGSGLKFDPTTR